MATVLLPQRDRAAAAALAAAIVGLLVWGLIAALAVSPHVVAESALKLFGVAPPPPPPKPEPVRPPRASYRPSGAAAPPAKRSAATPVAAPVPVVVVQPPPPIVTATIPFEGAQATQGASTDGPGTGAGGEGNGTGAGGSGNGDGAGDVPPRQIGGRIRNKDYPREAAAQGIEGTVGVRYVVGVNGRVVRCAIEHSSGSPILDDGTCRLITERYRYKPGHDARGHPFEATIVSNFSWSKWHGDDAPPDDDREDDR